MSQLVTLNYNDLTVLFQPETAYLNATTIAKQFGKKPETYLKTERTKDYMLELSDALFGASVENQLVIVKKGGLSEEQGTWLHPKLAIDFARWLNPKFAVWCDMQIEKLLSKEVKPMTQIEVLLQSVQLLADVERRQKETELNVVELKNKVKELEYKTHISPNEYYTISGYAAIRGINVNVSIANGLGRKAAKLSRELDYPINKAHSEIFGQVNVYHVDILNTVFEDL